MTIYITNIIFDDINPY